MERAHLYLHHASIGDAAACSAVRCELSPVLNGLSDRDEVAGYRMVVVEDLDVAEDELLPHMFDYASRAGGRFPFIFVLLPAKLDIDELMRARAFQRVA